MFLIFPVQHHNVLNWRSYFPIKKLTLFLNKISLFSVIYNAVERTLFINNLLFGKNLVFLVEIIGILDENKTMRS